MLYLHNTFKYEALDSAQLAVGVHLVGLRRDRLNRHQGDNDAEGWAG